MTIGVGDARAAIAVVLTLSVAAAAQTPKPLAFEVASVRLSPPGARGPTRVTPAGVVATNISLRNLVLMAFRTELRYLDAPDWLNDVRVDVHATTPAGTTRDQIPAMLRSLLAERLGLVTHTEQRQLPAYDLVVGPGGSKMREVAEANDLTKEFQSLTLPSGASSDITSETIDGPIRSMPITLGMRAVTERSVYERFFNDRRTVDFTAVRITMPEFAKVLSSNLDEAVFDTTGLTGVYQFTIELPPDASTLKGLFSRGITTTVQGTSLTEPTGVSTLKAVEGLGLKLERRKAPLDVIVVDRILRAPTEN